MKQKHLYSLLDQTFTTVRVKFPSYNPDENYKGNKPRWNEEGRSYTYKVPRHWDVAEGSELLVLTSSGLLIVDVVSVDLEPDIDLDANFDYKWAVQKVDRAEYDELVAKEKTFHSSMVHIERVKQRESLINSFRESLPEGSEARRLFEQTTSSLAPIAPPAAPLEHPWTPDHPSDPDEGHLG